MTTRAKIVTWSAISVTVTIAAAVLATIYFVRPDMRMQFSPYLFTSLFLSGFTLGILLTNVAYQE